MLNEVPDNLYHYTNVSSLAMILKNKSIRFSPLTVLDDKEEEKIQDRRKYGKYVFVSSWTDSAMESIPMWKMYTSPADGVRISLPKYPFYNYKLTETDFKDFPSKFEINGDILIPSKEFIYSDYLLTVPHQQNILRKVKYTDDYDKLYPQIINVVEGNTQVSMGNLGKYKNTYWGFQNEWRYILRFLPISLKDKLLNLNSNQLELVRISKCLDLPFAYYYLKLDEAKLKNMEITLSPQISDGNRIIVDLLVEKYNSVIQITESKLHGRI